MSIHELAIAFEFVYTSLSTDSALTALAPGGVWRGVAPVNTATPFVVFAYQSGTDSLTMNAVRMMTLPLLQVKVVAPASATAQIAQGAVEVDRILKSTSGVATGGLALACYREQPLWLEEIVDGVLWCNAGGLYRLEIQQTS